MVSARWVGTITHVGGMRGALAVLGTEVTFHWLDILRIENDRFAKHWYTCDALHLMTQLGTL